MKPLETLTWGRRFGIFSFIMKKWILLFLIGFLLTVFFTTFGVYRRTLPVRKGRVEVEGIQGPIRIDWDIWGVPHISAENEEDLFFAQGYAVAQDRLWQMDFLRRVASGRLAEIFGRKAVETDFFMRKIGCDRIAQKILQIQSPLSMRALEAYARGVNEWIRKDRIGIEFRILRYRPEPWKPLDSIAIGRLIGWDLANWKADLVMGDLVQRWGLEKAQGILPSYESAFSNQHSAVREMENSEFNIHSSPFTIHQSPFTIYQFSGGSSNAWVVDGTKSVTGKPLLANDPHLPLSLPSQWIEVHLSGGGYEVLGVTLPGIPGVLIGHNQKIAWGFTSAMADDVDFFLLRTHPQDSDKYLWEGNWKEMEVLEVEIRVKGEEEPLRRRIRLSHHGPILFEVRAKGCSPQLAMRWTGFETTDELLAILLLNRASDWEGFKEAMSHFKVPPSNVIYGDAEGNIGYLLAGLIPLREEGGWRPLSGWENRYEWNGFIPYEELPRRFNPGDHFIVTANQPVPIENPSLVSHLFGLPDRAMRIEERLLEKEKLSLKEFQEIQTDPFSSLAKRWMEEILKSLGRGLEKGGNEKMERAYQLLAEWNFRIEKESSGAALFEVFMETLLKKVFLDPLGEDLFQEFSNFWLLSTTALDQVLSQDSGVGTSDSDWFGGMTREEVFDETWVETMAFLTETLGEEPSDWQWGRLHTVHFVHPLGRVFPFNHLFNLGPYPYSGDGRTLLRAQSPHARIGQGNFKTLAGDSYRYFIDLSQPEKSYSVLPPGQSGLWGTRHYGDQMELWLEGEVHPNSMEGFEVESSLFLIPEESE